MPEEMVLYSALEATLAPREATIFRFEDGDVLIFWDGTQQSVVNEVRQALYFQFQLPSEPAIDQYYDLQAHEAELRSIIQGKLKDLPVDLSGDIVAISLPQAEMIELPPPTPKQMAHFHMMCAQRKSRSRPDILVVEDMAFSRKLLHSLLIKSYRTATANNALNGWKMHLQYAPDILMLDIELPDASGHVLARDIRRIDPDVFIVMVTGNHHLTDVQRSKEYGAKGFVVKPYNIQKIMAVLQTFNPVRK